MSSRALLPLLLVALVGIGACGGDSKSDKAMANVCAARADIQKQVDGLKGLTVTTATTSQVTDGLQAIRDDLATIRSSREDLSDDRRKDVQAANDEFKGQVQEIATTV